MDKTKLFCCAEERLAEYRKWLVWPEPHWLEDVKRGLNLWNSYLFKSENSVEEMKKKNGTPQNNFPTRFRRYVHMTPRDYRTHHRIEAAKILLADEKLKELRIADIGWLVGYEKPNAFSMMFKKKTGLSPGKWLELHSNGGKK